LGEREGREKERREEGENAHHELLQLRGEQLVPSPKPLFLLLLRSITHQLIGNVVIGSSLLLLHFLAHFEAVVTESFLLLAPSSLKTIDLVIRVARLKSKK